MDKQLEHYVRTALPEPYKVIGVRLKTFTLGHYLLLHGSGCTLSYNRNEITKEKFTDLINQLVIAVSICSRDYEEFQDFRNNKLVLDDTNWLDAPHVLWNTFLNKATKSTYPQRWYKHLVNELTKASKLTLKNKTDFNILLEFQTFQRYMNDGIKEPRYFNNSSSDETSGAHFIHSLIYFVRKEMKCKKPHDYPMAQAIADWCKFLEDNGVISLMKSFEIEVVEAAEATTTEPVPIL